MLATVLLLAASATIAAERVVLISVDGLRADALVKLGPEKTPTLHRLMSEGSSTLNARSDRTWTYTMPNHVCMATGRPSAGSEGHGYVENTFEGVSIHENKRAYVASAFDVVHDHGFRAALISSKPKFMLFNASYVQQGAKDAIPPDHGRRKLDQITITLFDDRQSIDAALGLLRVTTPPKLIFLHVAGPDLTGHTLGFEVEEGSDYLAEVQRQDALLGRILYAVAARGSLTETTAIILTSDHGGSGRRHSDPNQLEHHRVPFIVWGPGVARGADLYALNPARADPGRDKEGPRPPIRNCDAGNVALSLLGLPPIPGSVFRDLRVSQNSGGIAP
jgi:predicted AlkP superfamily pyrophosphatase or phosphodiesterase